mgnify:CR=1 FL=1
MKKALLVVLVLILAVFAVWKFVFKKNDVELDGGNKLVAMSVSKHSQVFNESMQKVMNAYYAMTEAFVQWDSSAVQAKGEALKQALDSLKITEMQKDTAIYPVANDQWEAVKSEIDGMITDSTLADKRASLNMLSQQMFDLLRIIKYDVAKVYFQECPMALNNYEMAANWLSPVDSIRNPYLGLKDPKYGKEMVTCGSTKSTLDYIPKDSTKN